MKLAIRRRYVLGSAAAVLLVVGLGGWWVGARVWKSTGQFVPHPDDPRVLYEPGAEVMAGEVAWACRRRLRPWNKDSIGRLRAR